jgi:phenylacetic acid degradation operon negative regulatory protein
MPARAPLPRPHSDPHVARWIARELAAAPPRAPSLVVTVWGDAIAPHGGAVMLPGLIRLLTPFGINERLVRTSVFRLARESWLSARRVGRRSLYRLTPDGGRRFQEAYRRIYAPPAEAWDGSWEVVVADGVPARSRQSLRAELRWEGFGAVAAGVFSRPSRGGGALARILAAHGAGGHAIAARAHDDAKLGGASLADAVPLAWDLPGIAADYRRFLKRFGGVIERFRRTRADDRHPEQCFVARTLLVHEYRRVMLRDPRLPAALLPLDWPGLAAYALTRDFYRLVRTGAERHLVAVLEGPRGTLPSADATFFERFGGLDG